MQSFWAKIIWCYESKLWVKLKKWVEGRENSNYDLSIILIKNIAIILRVSCISSYINSIV